MINRRKPIISIIISSNNDYRSLKKCVESFLPLKNKLKSWEFVVINNHTSDFEEQRKIQYYLNLINADSIVFYQTSQKMTSSQLKNLGLHFAKGNWLLFVDSKEIANEKFVKFLANYKFSINNDFYRFSIEGLNTRSNKIGIIKNKFYSVLPSSIIFNQEFVEKQNIKWENNLNWNDTLVILNKIYSITNVNYVYVPKQSSVVHDFVYDQNETLGKSFDEILQVYESLLRNKDLRYKQFIIVLFYTYLQNIKRDKETYKKQIREVKKLLKQAKIRHHNYFFIGFKLYFKTFKIRLYSKV